MHLRSIAARVANIAGALGAFAGLATLAHYAMADGIEGARRHPRPPATREAQAPETYPDMPGLLGGLPAAIPAALPNPCISLEEAYRVISATTESESIDAINIALNEVVRNPAGPPADAAESPLTGRLRDALNMTGSGPPCEAVLLALSDAVQLALVASTADAANATGAVGEPSPLSPVAYYYIPPSTPGGDGGWGYRVGRD